MLAFTFPGQGSQRPGMGRPWIDHPSWELVGEASEVAGRDVARLLLEAEADELRATHNAQLASFVLSLVVLDAVERTGLVPAVCAGHSLGEYTALAATGALGFEDGVRVVTERGAAMHEASELHEGTMAALLGIEDDDAEIACRKVEGGVWVANYNAPGQVVIAGAPDAVAAASEEAKGLGARRAMPLEVAGAFHTPLMEPARDRLRKVVEEVDFRDHDVPVVANIDARGHRAAAEWPQLLVSQLCNPVRWRQSLDRMADDGVTTFVELGGNVLTGMVKRTVRGARLFQVTSPDELDHLMEGLAGDAPATADVHEGEHLHVTERVVVSPCSGTFSPAGLWSSHGGSHEVHVEVGDVLGAVGDEEVRSPFAGRLMGLLVMDGERVAPSQPVAWLRTA